MTLNKARRSGTLGLLVWSGLLATAPLALAQAQGSFTAADANHDGRVTLSEFEAYAEQKLATATGFRAQRFRALSPEQQQSILQQRFAKLDHGNKGYLDQSDWSGS